MKLPCVNVSDAATFEVWLNPAKSTPLGYIIFKKSTFAIALQDLEVVFAFGNLHPGWKWIHSDWRAPLDQWSHVAVTYDEATQSTCIYINGELRKTAEVRGALQIADNNLQVGVKSFKKSGATRTRYVGRIADVRVWNVVLPARQLAEEWGRQLAGNERGLIGWWPFDEGAGTVVLDRAGAQHGEVHGPEWLMSVAVPPSDLSKHMAQVLKDGVGADVVLRAAADGDDPDAADNDRSIHAHRAILSARCPVFRAMFAHGMKESSQQVIVLSDIAFSTLQMLVEFLYTDELDIKPEMAVEMFIVADKYRLERLQRMCECVILNALSRDNVCQILETADALNASQLRGIAFRWIIHNFGQVLQSQGYTELDKSLQHEVNMAASRMHFTNSRSSTPSSSPFVDRSSI